MIEKRREFNLEIHLLFIDYKKAFDNIQRQILFNILKSRHISDTLLKAIVDIYTQNKILIKFNKKLSKPVEINKGVRQGCPLSPTLFNIYLDEIITKWQKQDITGKLSKNQQLSMLLFSDDQVIIADTEDNLQKAVHKLNQIITEYSLSISVQKTQMMAFKGRDPVRTKIVIKGKGKSVLLQAWSGPECSRKLWFPDFMTTAQGVGKVISHMHRPHLLPGNSPGTHFF